MTPTAGLDAVDHAILDLLTGDGRRSLTEIGERVNLSPAPVKRRIDRLERMGVITGYTAIIDPSRLGVGFEAFIEVRYAGTTDIASIRTAASIPEVIEVLTIAGDPDALVRIRVSDTQHLQRVVDALRRAKGVVGTKTLIVLDSWRRLRD